MCGIIGYTGKANSISRIIEGLTSLEYRGYDSAGVAYFEEGKLNVVKASGRIANVSAMLGDFDKINSHCGIGHTRWATHGAPTDINSHPHGTDILQIVHNGIIENYASLKTELIAQGYEFRSETDTEVASFIIDQGYRKTHDHISALKYAATRITGSYAIGVVFADDDDRIYAIRKDNPLIVGRGEGENFIASDIAAILRHTKFFYQMNDGEIAVVDKDNISFLSAEGDPIEKTICEATWSIEAAERGGHSHFMHKEIFEEPEAVRKTLSPRIQDMLPDFSEENLDSERLRGIDRLHIVACGTAMNAGLYGKAVFERYAGIPVEVEIASEFRYCDPIISERDMVMIISQSGETADSLAALRLAKQKGAYTLALVNVIGSSIAREADSTIYTWAGPEIAVASTKAYTVQSALLTLLSVHAARIRGRMNDDDAQAIVRDISQVLPDVIAKILEREEEISNAAEQIYHADDIFCIGRGADYYVAVEGALKIKEISYSHCEAYAAGELKHGTISLVENGTPVIALLTVPALYEKMISNVKEVMARGARVISVCAHGAEEVSNVSDVTIVLPPSSDMIASLASATVMQLLAFHIARLRGCDIDKPRNLAKSVTVE